MKAKYYWNSRSRSANPIRDTECFTRSQKLNITTRCSKDYNLFHLARWYSNRDIFTNQKSLAGILEYEETMNKQHQVIDFDEHKGSADLHFRHNFEMQLDRYRNRDDTTKLFKKDIYSFMVQLKSYLEVFSINVYKWSTTQLESKEIFDTFHKLKSVFKKDSLIDLACYRNIKTKDLTYHQYQNMANMIVKITPFAKFPSKTIYMLFSFNFQGEHITLIPALDYWSKDKDLWERLKEFEAAFIDIFSLVCCAMAVPAVVEVHEETFDHVAVADLWREVDIDWHGLKYYPMAKKDNKLKCFTCHRVLLGKIIKLRRFAGLNILWGEKFKTSNEESTKIWKPFLAFGSLRVPKANFLRYVLSSNDFSYGGFKDIMSNIFDDSFDVKDLTKEACEIYSEHLKLRHIPVLEYSSCDIEIDSLDSVAEVMKVDDITRDDTYETMITDTTETIKDNILDSDNSETWTSPITPVTYQFGPIKDKDVDMYNK
jgi:hypothetical protein